MYSLPPHRHSLPTQAGRLLYLMILHRHILVTQTLFNPPTRTPSEPGCFLPASWTDHTLTHLIGIHGAYAGNAVLDLPAPTPQASTPPCAPWGGKTDAHVSDPPEPDSGWNLVYFGNAEAPPAALVAQSRETFVAGGVQVPGSGPLL